MTSCSAPSTRSRAAALVSHSCLLLQPVPLQPRSAVGQPWVSCGVAPPCRARACSLPTGRMGASAPGSHQGLPIWGVRLAPALLPRDVSPVQTAHGFVMTLSSPEPVTLGRPRRAGTRSSVPLPPIAGSASHNLHLCNKNRPLEAASECSVSAGSGPGGCGEKGGCERCCSHTPEEDEPSSPPSRARLPSRSPRLQVQPSPARPFEPGGAGAARVRGRAGRPQHQGYN